jgi:DNA gyrase subunit A
VHAPELPDPVLGLTPLGRRVLGGLSRKTFRKTARALQRATGLASARLEERLLRAGWEEARSRCGRGSEDEDVALGAYVALVRFAQPFRSRYPLVEGRGNFGTIDGDPPADPVYNECRLSPLGALVVQGRAPNALLNGTPPFLVPHHAADVARLLAHLAERPGATLDELIDAAGAPDFATGGVLAREPLRRMYAGDETRLVLHATVDVEDRALVVRDVPWGTRKAAIVAQLVRARARRGLAIEDVEDHSDHEHSVRIVVRLAAGADPGAVRRTLFAETDLAHSIDVCFTFATDDGPARADLLALARSYLDAVAPSVTDLRELAALDGGGRRTTVV